MPKRVCVYAHFFSQTKVHNQPRIVCWPKPFYLFFPADDDNKETDKEKPESLETKEEDKPDKLKRAAVTAISAAAVKAKLLANQEEELIRQLSTLLIEKQVL